MSQRYTTAIVSSYDAPAPFWAPGQSLTTCGWMYMIGGPGANTCDLLFCGPVTFTNYFWLGGLGTPGNTTPVIQFFNTGVDNVGWNLNKSVTGIGRWIHLALVYSHVDGTFTAYVNGVVALPPTAANTTGMPGITHADVGYDGNFIAQDLFIFQSALSGTQIAQLRTLGSPSLITGTPSPYAWWKLDSANPTLDSSGNGRSLSNGGDAAGAQEITYPLNSATGSRRSALNRRGGVARRVGTGR